jgi:hypothetical protein
MYVSADPSGSTDHPPFTCQGPLALYNGLGVALIRAFPANAALFLGYELCREVLN